MGVTLPPPPPTPPPAPDQSSVEVQKFGALFRRKAAAASGYEGTFKAGPSGMGLTASGDMAPLPFHTDTPPAPAPPPTPGSGIGGLVGDLATLVTPPTPTTPSQQTLGATATPQTRIVIDPVTGMPVETTEYATRLKADPNLVARRTALQDTLLGGKVM